MSKNYFTQETEDAIIAYNLSEDFSEKSRIYSEKIHYAFFKLTQNIIHTFKFYAGGLFFWLALPKQILQIQGSRLLPLGFLSCGRF